MPKVCPVCGTTYPDGNAFCATDGSTLRAADVSADLVGSVVADRYLVTDFLGEGGMGRVYRARHVRLPQQAAIKVLRREQVSDGAAVARFNREAANASRINHDCVARVFDYGETADGLIYLAMEYVAGRTLHEVLHETGALDPRRAAAIVRRIADGLDAAHRLGIVHRDLKPDNVMVGDRDGADEIKVVDFGIAKALGAGDEGGAALTRTGYVVGTPEFMSPEQLLGAPLDLRSDVYALALVAYQCLTATLPFDSTTPEKGLTARLVDPPRRLHDARPNVAWPAEVEAVFDAGLARDPDGRPSSAGEFARRLSTAVDRWQAGEQVPADARIGVAVAAAVAPKAEPRPRGRSTPTRTLAGAAAALVVLVGGWTALRRGSADAATPTSASAVAAAPPTPAGLRPAAAPDSAAAERPPVAGRTTAPQVTSAAPPARAARTAAVPATPPRTAQPTAPESDAPVERSRGGGSARAVLDSLGEALQPANADEASARAALALLRNMAPRLTSASDRTWAQVRRAQAAVLSGDTGGACVALTSARRTARSGAETSTINRLSEQLACGG